MSDKLITIATFDDNIEAEFAKHKLEDYGIKSVLSGLNTGTTFAGVPAIVEVELQVMQSNAQKALEILNQPEDEEDYDTEDEEDYDNEEFDTEEED
jgi:hypothetical protein